LLYNSKIIIRVTILSLVHQQNVFSFNNVEPNPKNHNFSTTANLLSFFHLSNVFYNATDKYPIYPYNANPKKINKLLTNVKDQTIPLVIPPLQNPSLPVVTLKSYFCSPQTYLLSSDKHNLSLSHRCNHSSRLSNKRAIVVSVTQALSSLTPLLFFTFYFNILRQRFIYLHQNPLPHQMRRPNCLYA